MSGIATAIVGGAVIGYVASNNAADAAAEATRSGATTAAQAQILSTQLQIDEIARQFDYQQQILLPQLQQQYNAQGAFADLLGIGGLELGANPDTGFVPQPRTQAEQDAARQAEIDVLDKHLRLGNLTKAEYDREIARINARPSDEELLASDNLARGPQFPGRGSTSFQRGPNGEFLDPNLDPTRLADINTYGDAVRGNLLAGTTPEADPYRNYIEGNRIAAATPEQDLRFARARDVTMTGTRGGDTLEARRGGVSLADQRGGVTMAGERGGVTLAGERGGISLAEQRGGESMAGLRGNVLLAPGTLQEDVVRSDIAGRSLAAGAAGTGVYGDAFEASPGFAFSLEQAQRETDRLRSRGGNYGGRAVLEAQRRAQGLAQQEYYNWAAGRERDLQRLAGAEAADAGRLDTAAYGYQDRRTQDVLRGDTFAASDIARRDELARYDINRGDEFTRYDIGRGDTFAASDIGRGDEFARYDIGRGDTFAGTDLARLDTFAGTDIGRGDVALDAYEALRVADIGRQDVGYENYLRRREGDVARLDAAAIQEDQLRATDQQRRDQAYYNYLANLQTVAGFGGGPAAQAVSSSQAAGSEVAGAYGSQGSALSGIYSGLGSDLASIRSNQIVNQSNAITSGISNYITYRNSQ